MAIVLEAIYAKKLGLAGYSSHQFSVSIRTELTDLTQVEKESLRLYRLLQDAVDQSIQETGFLPVAEKAFVSNNGTSNGPTKANGYSNGSHTHNDNSCAAAWRCSDKQRDLIQKLVTDNEIDKHEVETIAQAMFGAGVRQLDKLQASGLIDELFVRFGGSQPKPTAKRGSKVNGHHRTNQFPPAPPLRNLPVPQHEGGWS